MYHYKMWFLSFLTVICFLVKFSYNQEVELIRRYNYTAETHHVETDDGYILEMYRISRGDKNSSNTSIKYPILLVHGWLGTAYNYLVKGPKKALAFRLANNGFDVWLVNCRGNRNSKKHKTLDPNDGTGRYWKFTWHEIGIYDVPNTIDYILNATNSEKLYYVGHSQANSAFFVMCSEKPEYNRKVKLFVALAPPVYFEYFKEPLTRSLSYCCYQMLRKWLENQNMYEFPPKQLISAEDISRVGRDLCGRDSFLPKSCFTFMNILNVGISDQLDPNIVPQIAEMGLGSSSLYQPCHYAQCIKTRKFMQYNWGTEENLKRYGSKIPREYNLQNATLPIVLVYGKTDWFSAEEDVLHLAKVVPNLVEVYKVPFKKWAHGDFLWGKDADKHLYSYIIKMLEKFLD